jgi:hypothetical protein
MLLKERDNLWMANPLNDGKDKYGINLGLYAVISGRSKNV